MKNWPHLRLFSLFEEDFLSSATRSDSQLKPLSFRDVAVQIAEEYTSFSSAITDISRDLLLWAYASLFISPLGALCGINVDAISSFLRSTIHYLTYLKLDSSWYCFGTYTAASGLREEKARYSYTYIFKKLDLRIFTFRNSWHLVIKCSIKNITRTMIWHACLM